MSPWYEPGTPQWQSELLEKDSSLGSFSMEQQMVPIALVITLFCAVIILLIRTKPHGNR